MEQNQLDERLIGAAGYQIVDLTVISQVVLISVHSPRLFCMAFRDTLFVHCPERISEVENALVLW